jgi:hypothetical protein
MPPGQSHVAPAICSGGRGVCPRTSLRSDRQSKLVTAIAKLAQELCDFGRIFQTS